MLITPNDIRQYRPISTNLDDEKRLAIYIIEVEQVEIIPAIGASLYKSISDDPSAHAELLSGGYYNDGKCYFAGLKAAESLMVYARFALNQAVNATPFGMALKNAMDSSPVDDKTLFRHVNEAKNTGLAYLQQCLDYLAFQNGVCGGRKRISNRKFTVIKS